MVGNLQISYIHAWASIGLKYATKSFENVVDEMIKSSKENNSGILFDPDKRTAMSSLLIY